jgi:hypothetical protein
MLVLWDSIGSDALLRALLQRLTGSIVSKTPLRRRNTSNGKADTGNAEPDAQRLEFAGPIPSATAPSLDNPVADATLLRLEQGLYALEVGETTCLTEGFSGLRLPLIHLAVPPGGREQQVKMLGSSRDDEAWFGREGGTVIVKAPSEGGHVFVTAYSLPGQAVRIPNVEARRIDGRRSNGTGSKCLLDEPEEVRTELVLHVERLGDKRLPGQGWVGNRGKRLRIEAFSIRPSEVLAARDIEFKALGPKGRQTPWVTDAKLCGTRGQGLPLTGFAVRLAPRIADRFDAVYQGAFFESGVVGPFRNGELCVAPIADDPLEAINLQLTRRVSQ